MLTEIYIEALLVDEELAYLVPDFLKLISSFSCCFAVHSGFFGLLVNKIREALFVFPYLPVEIGVILLGSESRRLDGFCACV